MEKYLKVSVVGQGTYGIVYKVKCRSTGKEFALKRYNYGVEDSTVRELSCLAALKGHPYVVSVHDCFFDEGKVAMLLSYVPYTLSGIIHKGHGLKSYHEPGRVERSIPLSFVAHFSRQVAHALSCMHEMNIVHRDLTPFNVLLTEDLTVKVADMGLSRQCSKWMSPTVVTEAYRAPELFDECGKYRLEYTCAIDMWSLGVMIAEAMEGEVIFRQRLDHREKSMYRIIAETLGSQRPLLRIDCILGP
ncbi:cell division control protein 2 homolog 3-like [Amphiprion ocellaris]|uniref:Protein kinase domain-containing protein n=1 Tax=Amphiprion ocellaris TaxID=80972 RepID=A0A3Q1BBG5_AMPOC|nr:cell division control protein 2 homolog 3-like [Amphiprion ocellaris]